MERYLLDTTIFIAALRKNTAEKLVLQSIKSISISTVTYCEVIQGVRNKKQYKQATDFFNQTSIIEINKTISEKARLLVETYCMNKGMRLHDALIAATAMYYKIPLVTHNLKHFDFINGLQVVSPTKVLKQLH